MWLFIGLALIPIIAWTWTILTGKTTIDAKGLRRQVPFNQTGYDLRWHEIAAVRFINLPLVGRLVVKTQGPGAAKAFHVGNKQMKQAFIRLEKLYRP